ncbi:MAG: hypothetical protein HY749_06675 [Gammaproteobacteria bacterium]|nr:hypothetical protein [Gammaproteobacteria bacterium]MBI5614783.1 hypothetical protein [Gammaproteobacteria bacterium]
MSCAAPNLCLENTPARAAAAPSRPASVVRLAERSAVNPPRAVSGWTGSELAAVVGSTLAAVTLYSLIAFELVTKLEPPIVF